MFQSTGIFRRRWVHRPSTFWIPSKVPGELKELASDITGSTTFAGDLSLTKNLQTVVAGGTWADGSALSVVKPLASGIAGSTTVSGALAVTKSLASDITGSTVVGATLTVLTDFSATFAGTTTVSGSLAVTKPLAGASAGTTTVSGTLSVGKPLAASVPGNTIVAAALLVRKSLQAVIGTGTLVTADLSVGGGTLGASVTGSTSVSGSLQLTFRLRASIEGSTEVEGGLQVGGAVTWPPSSIIRKLLIDLDLGEASGNEWKVYTAFLPDTPDKAIVVYDTAGREDGRIMVTGEKVIHSGVSIQVRARDYLETRRKIERIGSLLDQQRRVVVTVNALDRYRVHNISRAGDILNMGMEPQGDKRRHYQSINATLTLEKI